MGTGSYISNKYMYIPYKHMHEYAEFIILDIYPTKLYPS